MVLLSGGMDSCVCAALAARDHQTAGVHVSYGQRTEERERRSFDSICDRLEIRDRLLVRNEALRAIGGSALTDSSIAVPEMIVAVKRRRQDSGDIRTSATTGRWSEICRAVRSVNACTSAPAGRQ